MTAGAEGASSLRARVATVAARLKAHGVAMLVVCCAVLAGGHERLGGLVSDWTFRALQRPASGEVLLVAIDPLSIREVGTWPWPRHVYGDLVDKLREAGATDIAFDIDFSSASRPEEDAAFAAALARADGATILPIFRQRLTHGNEHSPIIVNRPIPTLAVVSWPATVNVVPDPDGIIRHYPNGAVIDGVAFPSLARALAGGNHDATAAFHIDFGIDRRTLPIMSAADVLFGRADASRIANRKIIIGGTAIELGDFHNAPGLGSVPGFEIQALAAESILLGRTLREAGWPATVAGLAVLALVFAALRRRISAPRLTLALIAVGAALEASALLAQMHAPVLVDSSLWLVALLAYLGALWVSEIDLRTLLARLSAQRFNDVAAGIRDGVLCLDRNGTIVFCNAAAVAMFDYEADELIGRPMAQLFAGTPDFPTFLSASEQSHSVAIEVEGLRRTGLSFPLEFSLTRSGSANEPTYNLIFRDITARKEEAKRLRRAALTDALIGMPNRLALQEHLAQLAGGDSTEPFRVLLLNVVGFKDINDAFGTDIGDMVLKELGCSLTGLAGPQALVARVGGDEFAAVFAGPDFAARAEAFVAAVESRFNTAYFSAAGRALRVRLRIGGADFPQDGSSANDILANAGLALHAAAAQPDGNRVVPFAAQMRADRESERHLEDELRRAVAERQFVLFYQPQANLASGALIGAEALVRWQHPTRGILAPGAFLDVLHGMDVSDAFGTWVLQETCRQGAVWQRMGFNLRLGVNLSPSLMHLDLPGILDAALTCSGLTPSLLDVEVTENIMLTDVAAMVRTLEDLRRLGVGLAFDDFGTGFASLTHLKTLPIDRIKIDRSFVQHLLTDTEGAAIVQSIIHLARALDKAVIAEGIEDAETAKMLRLIGCQEGQGYLLGRPMPAEKLLDLAHGWHAGDWRPRGSEPKAACA